MNYPTYAAHEDVREKREDSRDGQTTVPMTKVRQLASSPIVIFAAALATRVAASVYIFATYAPPSLLFVGNESSNIAKALVSGFGFSSPYAHTPIAPTAQQPPIYPLFVAGIFKVFGVCTPQSAWAITAFHVVAGAITAVLILRLGKIYFKKNVCHDSSVAVGVTLVV